MWMHLVVEPQSQELIEYTSETVNKLNDYALGAILPSLVPLMLYAYTQELMYILLFFFLLGHPAH